MRPHTFNASICAALMILALCVTAQELYPSTEASSNSPKDVLRVRAGAMIEPQFYEVMWMLKGMYSVTDKLMLTATLNGSSDVLTNAASDIRLTPAQFRSATLYAKYRFFSDDAPHYHLRFAAFAEYDYATRDHITGFRAFTTGVKDGASAGIIGTWLRDRTAISATAGYFLPNNILLGRNLVSGMTGGVGQYSLSAGYLLFPLKYTSYDQVNVNLYCEFLGYVYTPTIEEHIHPDPTHTGPMELVRKRLLYNRLDIAPAVQFIVDSRAKIDLVFRTPLLDTFHGYPHWMASLAVEYYFF
jgi:hypothetical protein